ncbi:hypothetical protein Pcinc_028037 [Petrolisthes cinctipes]|uniref:C2H2-type domain-containing protein n=1 Tax=Petrolisthes cinctipes TaxID=88211 RepID=A0AAE1F2W1_PETCI|nr:hypothetical protein Pcinc_028037 [Petrolisthes cinctipes]
MDLLAQVVYDEEGGPVTFELVADATSRGKTLLVDNRGYTYTRGKETPKGISWRCTIRNAKTYCKATVRQKGYLFIPGSVDHCHGPETDALSVAKAFSRINQEVKARPLDPPGSVAKEIISSEFAEEPLDPITQAKLIRRAKYHRRSLHPKTIKTLIEEEPAPWTFEVVEDATKRGKPRLLDSRGYSYTQAKGTATAAVWRCTIRNDKVYCRATVRQNGFVFVCGQVEHCHPPDLGALSKAKFLGRLNKEARARPHESAASIVKRVLASEFSTESPGPIKLANLIRSVNYQRRAARPKDPSSLEFELNESAIPQGFLQADIFIAGKRHLIFTTPTMASLLAKARSWYCDARYSIVARPFEQLFSIHVFVKSGASSKQIPMVFILMSERRKEDYVAVLLKILELMPMMPQVQSITLDYEATLWAAAMEILPTVRLYGCHFSFNQVVWQKIHELELVPSYHNSESTQKFCRQVMALPFLPVTEIQTMFVEFTESTEDSSQCYKDLVNFVKFTWLDNSLWPPPRWSVFKRPIRTKNDFEGWLKRLTHKANKRNMGFYQLITLLYKESIFDENQVFLISEEEQVKCQRAKYSRLQAKIFEHWESFIRHEITPLDLLNHVSLFNGPDASVGEVIIGQAANIPTRDWPQEAPCPGNAIVICPTLPSSPRTRPRPASYRPCDLCGIIPFGDTQRHYAEHHPETLTRICLLCEARYRTFRQLSSHVLRVHGPVLICPICSVAFSDISDFQTHVQNEHSDIPVAFTCAVCRSSISALEDYCAHMETHQAEAGAIVDKGNQGRDGFGSSVEEENNTCCTICQKSLKSPSELKSHIQRVHGKQSSFQCQVCFLRYQSNGGLLDHMETHTTGAINCPLCCRQFAKFAHLRSHCDIVHGDTASFRCHHCSYSAKSIYALFTHAIIRHPDHLGLVRNIQCAKCGEKFHSGRELSQHRAARHPELVDCEHCGKQFSKYLIAKHINEKHTKEHKKECSYCSQTFYNLSRLSDHIKRHHKRDQYARFSCDQCSKSYITRSELMRHKASHQNIRRYKCEFCSHAYFKAGDLTYHRRTHTGERPHKCTSCDAAFIRPSELTTHLARVHSIHHHTRNYIRTAAPHNQATDLTDKRKKPTDEDSKGCLVNSQKKSTILDLAPVVARESNVACQMITNVGEDGLVVEVVGEGDIEALEGVEESMQMVEGKDTIHVPEALTDTLSKEHTQNLQGTSTDTQIIYGNEDDDDDEATVVEVKGLPHETLSGVGDLASLLQMTPCLSQHLTLGIDASGHNTITCQSCDLTFTSVVNVTSHHCSYWCERCGKEESTAISISHHYSNCPQQTLKSKRATLFSCEFCPQAFKTEAELQQHNKKHIGECLKQYAQLLKERGLAETLACDSQPPLKRGRPRKMNDCTVCGLIYKTPADHLRHLRNTHPEKLPHACRLCEERFQNQSVLEFHIVQHFLGSFKCDFCGIHFGRKYPFLEHLEANHAGDYLLKCEFCPYITASFHDYRNHRKNPHEGVTDADMSSTCQHCQELIPEDEMKEHLAEHQDSVPATEGFQTLRKPRKQKSQYGKRKQHVCHECNVPFPSPAALSRHNHNHHPQKYSHECSTCGHRFKGTRALRLHQDGHKNGSCWCPVCKLRFGQRLHVERHFNMAHSDVKLIDCEYCSEKFGSYSKYVYHCRTSHADLLEDRRELMCKQCGACVSNRILLKKHMAKIHGMNKQNAPKSECPVCKKFFVHIDAHMNLHTRAVQYPCKECGEVFFLKSSLIVHIKQRHDQNAKKHACHVCKKSFISSSLLRTHQEQVHMHKRQNFCEFCGRAYKNKSALTYHLKVHTGERPYKCQECGVGFHRPSTLKTHMEGTHHLPYSYVYRKPQRKAGTGIVMPKLDAPSVSAQNITHDSSGIVKIYVSDDVSGDVIQDKDIAKAEESEPEPCAETTAVSLRKCESGDDESSGHPTCPVCNRTFHFHSQLRRHVRHEHPDFDTNELDTGMSYPYVQNKRLKDLHMEVEEDGTEEAPLRVNFTCPWCEKEFEDEGTYDQHSEDHCTRAYTKYLEGLRNSFKIYKCAKNSELGTRENWTSDTVTKDPKGAVPGSDEEESNKVSSHQCQKCLVCDFTFQKKVELEYHMDKCHEDSMRCCYLCNEMCYDSITLRSHIVHHYDGVMECPVCPVRYSIKKHLLSHLKNFHSSGYEITCTECNKKFMDYNVYETHLAKEHSSGAIRTCEVCEKEIMALDYENHLSLHEEEASAKGEALPHVCNLCQASFMFVTKLYLHKHHEHSNLFPFQCNECERTFRTERMLKSHRWGHKYGSHQCPACRLKYRQVDQLKRHLLVVHPELEGYSCKFCPIILKNYSTYVAHLKFKHPKEAGYDKKPVRCTLCGESFAHKVQWKYHMRNHSRSLQTCRICGISVKNLEIHMNLHTKEKKFECSICGAIYHNKASFHFHVKRVHMGEEVRKHMCDICRKVFLTPSDLRIHMSRVHYGERNYWCPICNKGYKSKVSLTYHQRLHTGERPHHCNLCGRAFRVPSYLKRHMEHDHRAQYTGVYFKQGRPKNQDDRSIARRQHPHSSAGKEIHQITLEEGTGHIPEVVQITVPMEMGREVISSVSTTQELNKEHDLELEQGGVVYVVYEN